MSSDLAKKGRKLAKTSIYAQTVTSLVLIMIVSMINTEYTVSALFGCIAFLVPNGFFAYWVFRFAGATQKQRVVQSFNQGLKAKLILSVILFVIAFSKFNAHPLPLFGAYVITMFSHYMAMLAWRKTA